LVSDTLHDFFAPCPRGLSNAAAQELALLGATGCGAAEAGVSFRAPLEFMYVANLHSRISSRILWRLARFPYRKEDDIYAGAKAIRWRDYFLPERTFKVETNAHRSPVKSLDFVTLRVKDAIADQFRGALGKRPSVSSRDPDVRVHAFLDAKSCTLYVDTTG
jgi:putative N6-adenine-specific DNA methylase